MALRILSILLITPVNHLCADYTDYPCRRYNIRDQVPISSLEFSRDGKRLVVSAQSAAPPELRVIDLFIPQPEIERTKITAFGNQTMGECASLS